MKLFEGNNKQIILFVLFLIDWKLYCRSLQSGDMNLTLQNCSNLIGFYGILLLFFKYSIEAFSGHTRIHDGPQFVHPCSKSKWYV